MCQTNSLLDLVIQNELYTALTYFLFHNLMKNLIFSISSLYKLQVSYLFGAVSENPKHTASKQESTK